MSDTRIVASVDRETKEILVRCAREHRVSLSAVLRLLATEIEKGKVML
jgi:hypothetical protein